MLNSMDWFSNFTYLKMIYLYFHEEKAWTSHGNKQKHGQIMETRHGEHMEKKTMVSSAFHGKYHEIPGKKRKNDKNPGFRRFPVKISPRQARPSGTRPSLAFEALGPCPELPRHGFSPRWRPIHGCEKSCLIWVYSNCVYCIQIYIYIYNYFVFNLYI